MNIKSVNAANNVIKLYGDNKRICNTKEASKVNDSIEISSLAKSLSSRDIDIPNINNGEKIESIRRQISNGTYKPNAELVAKKIIDIMKGREF